MGTNVVLLSFPRFACLFQKLTSVRFVTTVELYWTACTGFVGELGYG